MIYDSKKWVHLPIPLKKTCKRPNLAYSSYPTSQSEKQEKKHGWSVPGVKTVPKHTEGESLEQTWQKGLFVVPIVNMPFYPASAKKVRHFPFLFSYSSLALSECPWEGQKKKRKGRFQNRMPTPCESYK